MHRRTMLRVLHNLTKPHTMSDDVFTDMLEDDDFICNDEEPTLEDSIRALVRVSRGVLKVIGKDHPLAAGLSDAIDNAEPWLETEDDPRSMGWVGADGLP